MQTPTRPPNKRALDPKRAAKLRRLIKRDGTPARIAELVRISKFTVLGAAAETPVLAPQREVIERYIDSIGEDKKTTAPGVQPEAVRDHNEGSTLGGDDDEEPRTSAE